MWIKLGPHRISLTIYANLSPQLAPVTHGVLGDEETVILQFGKIEDDAFTMDFRYPLVSLPGVRHLPRL